MKSAVWKITGIVLKFPKVPPFCSIVQVVWSVFKSFSQSIWNNIVILKATLKQYILIHLKNILKNTKRMKRSLEERHTRKLDWNVSMSTNFFLDQKRVNVCENMVKTTLCEGFRKNATTVGERQEEGRENGMEIIWG